MARKTETIVLGPEFGRDAGKTFQITEMSARQAERWADRAFLALSNSNFDMPPGLERSGMSGIVEVARLVGGLRFDDLAPLMDELLACAQIVPDPKKPFPRALIDDGINADLEEISARHYLRQKIMDLHDFRLAAVVLGLIKAASELTIIPTSETMSMFHRQSEPSSQLDSQPSTN